MIILFRIRSISTCSVFIGDFNPNILGLLWLYFEHFRIRDETILLIVVRIYLNCIVASIDNYLIQTTVQVAYSEKTTHTKAR